MTCRCLLYRSGLIGAMVLLRMSVGYAQLAGSCTPSVGRCCSEVNDICSGTGDAACNGNWVSWTYTATFPEERR